MMHTAFAAIIRELCKCNSNFAALTSCIVLDKDHEMWVSVVRRLWNCDKQRIEYNTQHIQTTDLQLLLLY